MAASELSSRGGRARSHVTHDSAGPHLDREARSEAEEHVAASELSSRRGKARSHGTRGSAGAHLDREVRYGAEEHVAAPELNSARRRGLGRWDKWQHQSSHQQEDEVRGRRIRDGSGAHLCRDVTPTFYKNKILCK
jgi:hypothetical protein